jgi:hypothetical protein
MIQGQRIGECISCGALVMPDTKNWQAGHYYSIGAYPNLRYDELNINGQCLKCNVFKEGNKQGYREGYIKRYGEAKLSNLEMKKGNILKLVEGDYVVLIKHYKNQIEKLEKKHAEERRKYYGG